MEDIKLVLFLVLLLLVAAGIVLFATRYYFWKDYERRAEQIQRLSGRVKEPK